MMFRITESVTQNQMTLKTTRPCFTGSPAPHALASERIVNPSPVWMRQIINDPPGNPAHTRVSLDAPPRSIAEMNLKVEDIVNCLIMHTIGAPSQHAKRRQKAPRLVT